ncbi:uncharacterized protein LOC106754256 [Vigna radiata var. radiata]|uniref:Uncharacterized protein LOC106754256 n=1 Tax=Vigna radiata var. radiata TaxID=3916 RepID=A0A1S3TDA1_VIGRR|nr:uncharacterized protein LOC106754256 [Vigna radiata var. radiata]
MMLIRSRYKLVKNFGISVSGSLGICMHSTTSVLDSLQNRVLKVSDPMIPVGPILDQWVKEGREVTEFQFRDLVRRLHQFCRCTHSRQGDEVSLEQALDGDDVTT